MSNRVLLHGVAGPSGAPVEGLLVGGLRPLARFRPMVGGFDRVVAAVSGPGQLIERVGDGLPDGEARAEAVAVRLRRQGHQLEWGEPQRVRDGGELLRLCHARGRSSIDMARADPSLVTELQLGGWFDTGWRGRLVRRASLSLPHSPLRLWPRGELAIPLSADLAFWRGVRRAATAAEWQRLTRSSYVALVYHRLAGELKPSQERVDLAPAVFDSQLDLLRRLGFSHLPADEVLAFHENQRYSLPRRSFVVTFDDGFADCVTSLLQHAGLGPQLFVSTRELGGSAHWLDDEPVMGWEDVRFLAAAGVRIGAHARRHRRLGGLGSSELRSELEGARSDLSAHVDSALDVLAYPYGDHDAYARRAALEAGFRAAFTTEKGRNGAGTDVFCLRRVSVHRTDGALAVLWKVVTGEDLPGLWHRLRALRAGLGAARGGHRQAD